MKIKFTPLQMRTENNEQRWHWCIDGSASAWIEDPPHLTETYERAVEALERVVNEDKIPTA